jgi:hypothetical protein
MIRRDPFPWREFSSREPDYGAVACWVFWIAYVATLVLALR